VEDAAVGAAKKRPTPPRLVLFEDESGVSQQPVVRRTWAPRGETPVLIHTGVIGAIRGGDGTGEQDHECAEAGAAAVGA
jgi:uncharacterized protein GlcG (DUF336 family)